MKGVVVVLSTLAACVPDEPDEPDQSVVESALIPLPGQGITYQGITYQGITYQGITYQGTAYDGASLQGGEVQGTALVGWRSTGTGKAAIWEQLFPDHICRWNWNRTIRFVPCSYVDLRSQPSPLAGTSWPGTFRDPAGQPVVVPLRIAGVRADLGGRAMHGLIGSGSTCAIEDCGNANGCRVNCDIWLYDVDAIEDDQPIDLCAPGERAIAIDGTYDATGERTTGNGKFTFACTNGTIAKCTQWGYRPFGSAKRCNEQEQCEASPVPLADYHQACIRAAIADYCTDGRSFTRNGTLVDIWDYMAHGANQKGFVPRTWNLLWHDDEPRTALIYEAKFDRHGAAEIDFTRYHDLGNFQTGACTGRFSLPLLGDDGELLKAAWRKAPAPPETPPFVAVDSTTRCAHSEHVIGAPLHHQCSSCTLEMWQSFGADYAKCTGTAWDADCKAAATVGQNGVGPCAAADRMASHGECTTGSALPMFASGCTIRVCASNPACCSSGWTAACVTAADQTCTGGQERVFPPRGFCALEPVTQQ